MKKIIGVKIDNKEKIHYCYADKPIQIGYNVIIETEIGKFFATVATEIHDIDEKKLTCELGKIIRVATKDDFRIYKSNLSQEEVVMSKCKKLIKKYNLNMNVLECKFTFNKDQLIIKYFSEDRVDFRELAKDLAAIFKTRIELRQIGVRDKAKEVSGIGVCGQKLCCSRFLQNFDPVSISMAKNQNLALNPSKINGVCGRLMCCLKYEDECYKSLKKGLPTIGKEIKINDTTGKVISIDILKRKVRIQLENGNIVEEIINEDY